MNGTLAVLIGAASAMCFTPASAQEAYLRGGLPGIGVGYTHSLDSSWNLRGEFSTLGNRSFSGTREGVNFDAELKADQVGIYADWFPSASGFRFSGGVSSNNVKFNGNALPSSNGTVTINNTSVPFGAGDSYSVEVKMPAVTPYVGVGWGHRADTRGWGFVADLGAYLGKLKATSSASQSVINKLNAAGVNAQAEIDAQTRKIQDGLDKFSVLPMLTLGVSYRW
jgi:hypothetical protein